MNDLKKKLGQLIMIGFPGYELPSAYEKFIIEGNIGGTILFGRNIRDEEQLFQLCEQLQTVGRQRSVDTPFLIALDQEGGLVNRLGRLLVPLPSAMLLGEIGDLSLIGDLTVLTVMRMKEFGFSVNFAPVVDCYYPLNRQLLTRTYSSRPEEIITSARIIIKVHQDNGIIPCIKHFPGLGPCLRDTHFEAGVVTKSRDDLRAKDLLPFKILMKDGVPMVMISHAAYPSLTENNLTPASLSLPIATTLLREEFGYSGISVSDDLEMKSITSQQSVGTATLMAIQAGCDLALICHTITAQQDALSTLQQALDSGTITVDRVMEAISRIEKGTLSVQSGGEMIPSQENPQIDLLFGRIDKAIQSARRIICDPSGLLPLNCRSKTRVHLYLHRGKLHSEDDIMTIHNSIRDKVRFLSITDFDNDSNLTFPKPSSLDTNRTNVNIFIGHNWHDVADLEYLLPGNRKVFIFLLTGDPAESEILPDDATIVSLIDNSDLAVTSALRSLFVRSLE